jgi:dicarboxylate transporter DctA-like protein
LGIAKKIALSAAALVLVTACATAYVWLDRRELAVSRIHAGLQGAGIEAFSFELTEVGLWGASLNLVRIGPAVAPDVSIETLTLHYTPIELASGHIRTIEVSSPNIKILIESGGVSFGALDPVFAPSVASGSLAVTIGEILISDAVIGIATPQSMLEVMGSARVTQSEAGWRFEPDNGCLGVSVGAMQSGPVLLDSFVTDFCLPDEGPVVDWPLKQPLAVAANALSLALRGDQGEIILAADLATAVLEIASADLSDVRLQISGGEFMVPGFQLGLSGVGLRVSVAVADTMSADWKLEGALLEDLSVSKRFVPIRLGGDGDITPATVSFDLIVSDPESYSILSSVSGGYQVETAVASAVAQIGPLLFSEVGLQPQKIVPSLAGVVTNVVGSASGVARFHLQNGTLTSSGTFDLDGVGLSTSTARVEEVSGRIEFGSLVPPATAPSQSLTVGLVDAGFQLMDGVVAFLVNENGSVQVESATWPFAGGVIRLSSGLIEPGAATQDIVLDVEEVALSSLISLVNFDGVSGTGTVSGRVPVQIRNGNPIITGAELTTKGPGQLSYKGDGTGAISEGQSALLFQALENFQYTGLTLSLDGNAQDRLTVKLNLEGANPELYDGYPFVININTEASFAELLRSATLGTRALDIIRDTTTDGL